MERENLIDCLKSIDFKISRQGVLSGPNDMKFGLIQSNCIRTMDGRSIPFESAISVAYEGMDETLALIGKDGMELCRFGGSIDNVDNTIVQLHAMPETDSELNDVFQILYPDSYDKLYYDVLDEREMVDLSLFDQSGGVVPLNDQVENIYLDHIERRLKAENFVNHSPKFRPPSVEVRRRVLMTQIHRHERNRFREWVESLTWDGVPRIATWFKKIFKASAPPLKELGMEDKYLSKVAEAWFIGGIRRMYEKTQHDIVPVLIGGQGVGKSSGLEYTAGPGDWFAATTINISAPGGIAQFLDSVRGKIVVELAEATTIRSADQEALKAFISKTEDQYRKPYARYENKFPRHFIMAASTNISNIFTDITGNRRFYPIYCGIVSDAEKKTIRTKGDSEQVWAEALALYRDSQKRNDEKHVWYIPSRWKPALVMQRYCTQDNLNVSVIDDWLDDFNNGYTELGSEVTKDVIMNSCFGLNPGGIPPDCKKAWNAWINTPGNWELTFKKIGKFNKTTRVWKRVREVGFDPLDDAEEIEKIVSKIESGSELMTADEIVCLMRERAAKYRFSETGDKFPADGLDQQTLDLLLDEGYIYDSSGFGDYRLGVLP